MSRTSSSKRFLTLDLYESQIIVVKYYSHAFLSHRFPSVPRSHDKDQRPSRAVPSRGPRSFSAMIR